MAAFTLVAALFVVVSTVQLCVDLLSMLTSIVRLTYVGYCACKYRAPVYIKHCDVGQGLYCLRQHFKM